MPSFFFHVSIDLDSWTPSLNYGPGLASDVFTTRPERKTPPVSSPLRKGSANPRGGVPVEWKNSAHQLEPDRSLGDRNSQHDAPKNDMISLPSLSCPSDWRWGKITMQGTGLPPSAQKEDGVDTKLSNGQFHGGIGAGLATKGKFEALELGEEELGWGVVRLYRDNEETPGLYDNIAVTKGSKVSRNTFSRQGQLKDAPSFKDEDCTTLCILAVPSYLTPSDFLGFVGEKTRDEVCHFRMIRTERSNRYMVIMKFRNGKRAREWRKEWNGKTFNDMDVSLGITVVSPTNNLTVRVLSRRLH